MSTERMSDEHLAVYEAEAQECDGLTPSACRDVVAEARRARAEEARLREENEHMRGLCVEGGREMRRRLDGVAVIGAEALAKTHAAETEAARLQQEVGRLQSALGAAVQTEAALTARAEMAEQTRDGLREENGRLCDALEAADLALDEFSSHHQREDGRQRTVPECVEEAMGTLRARIASLEAECAKLRDLATRRAQALEQIRARAHDLDQLGPAQTAVFSELEQMAKEAP